MQGLNRWTAGVAILLVTAAAVADGERPLREARSQNGRFVLRVEPGQPGRAGRSCTATLFGESQSGRAGRRVWERALVNDAAPTHAAVRDDGRFVVTLDEYRRGGARNAVVIYGSEGELLRHFLLSDLLEKDDWPHVKVDRRELGWLTDARLAFDDQAGQFIIELPWGRKVRIDLKTLQVVRAGERAGMRLAVIPPEILAQLLGHLEGGAERTVAEKLAEVAQLTPEEQAQAAAIGEQLAASGQDTPRSDEAATSAPSSPGAEVAATEPTAPGAERAPQDAAHSTPDVAVKGPTGEHLAVPPPNPAEKVDYVAWLNQFGRVDGLDANPVYQAAVAHLVPWEGNSDLLPAATRGDPAALASPELAAWLGANAAALATFREASQSSAKSCELHSEDGSMLGVVLPELSSLRTLARATVIEGRQLARADRPAEAVERYLDVLAAGAHTGSGFTLIENLVGVAMQSPAADALLDLQAEPSADGLDYATLASELERAYEPTRPASAAIQLERAFFLDTMQRVWDVNPQTGACVVNAGEVNKLCSALWEPDDARSKSLQDDFARVGFEDTVTEGNLYYNALADALARPYPEAARRIEQLESVMSNNATANPVLRQITPSLGRYEFLTTRAETTRRATLLVTRLRAYQQQRGDYPAALDALGGREYAVDPFSAAPFVYRRAGSGFVLYSVGRNGVDDAGAADREGETNDLVFWPRPK